MLFYAKKLKDILNIQTFRQKDYCRTELWSCKMGTFFFCVPVFHVRQKVKCVPVLQRVIIDNISYSSFKAGQSLSFRKMPCKVYFYKLLPDDSGKIFQLNRQSKDG